ncbi:MAG: fibronectin type III domain-containing protein [bacterium]
MKKSAILVLGLVWYFIGISQAEANWTIRGTITTSTGTPTSGVQVTLSGNMSSVTTTSADGTYAFKCIPDGTYTVTPDKLWVSFTPGSRTVQIDGANVDNVNFTANYGPPTIRITSPSPGDVITSEGSIATTFEIENFSIAMAPDQYYEGYIILVLYCQPPGQQMQPVWTGFVNQTSYSFKHCVPGTYTVEVGLADMFHTRQHNPESKDSVTFRFELAPGIMNPVKNFKGESNDNTIRLTWENPYNAYFSGVLIVRGTEPIGTWTPQQGATSTYKVGSLTNGGKLKVIYNDRYETYTDESPELVPLVNYYYTAFAYDKDGTYSSGTEDMVTLNDTPPAKVTDLDSLYWTAITDWQPIQPTSFSIILNWTAPGADGNQGQASTYTIKWTTEGTNTLETNFDGCDTAPGMIPKPSFAGVRDHMVVIGTGTDDRELPFGSRTVKPETTYFFALKTSDRGGQKSPMSNVFQKTTLDETPPGTITNLAIANPNIQEGSLMLVWKAPGDDGDVTWIKDKGYPERTDDKYDIRCDTMPITIDTWPFTKQIGTATPKKAGAAEVFIVENLELNKYEYYFAIRTVDEQYNTSGLSNVVSTDMIGPGSITDLKAGSVTASTVNLTWTHPGDNGTQGVANSYDVRYYYDKISEDNWDNCFEAFGEPKPASPFTKASFTVTGLSWNKTYWFALKAVDEAGNKSPLSNVVQATTKGDLPTPPTWGACTPGDTVLYLSWTPSSQLDIGGYLLYYDEKSYEGSVTKAYAHLIDVGNVTKYTLEGLENDKKYYMDLRAYNTNSYPSDYSKEICRTPVGLGYQYEPMSVIIPMGNQQEGDIPIKLNKIRNAYKACFNHVYKYGNMEWTASTSYPYHGKSYNVGTFISEYSPATDTVISFMNFIGTPTPDYVITEPGVGTGNVLGVSKSFSLQPIKIALFYSDLVDEYEQYITWEEGYFERIFRMYLWGEYFDRVSEKDIREGKLANYDLVIFPSVKKGYVEDVVGILTQQGVDNLKSFVANGGILYAQGECVYLVEKLGLVGTGTVDLQNRVTDMDNKGQLNILDTSHPLTFSWLANETYVLDDPLLLEKDQIQNATQTIIAKYIDTDQQNSVAIIYVEHQLGAAIMMPSHPSDKTEYYPLVLDAVLLAMSRKSALTLDAEQKFCEEVPKDIIPGLEADVPVYVTVTFCNFWNKPLEDVVVKSIVQPGFNIIDNKSDITPSPNNITREGTITDLGPGTLTTITWELGQVDENTKLNLSFWVFTDANALKKGEAVVCKTSANYKEVPGGQVTVYARDVKMRAKMAARLVGDRALDKLTAYGIVGSGIFSDVVFPVENKEDTLAKNVRVQDLVALVAPIVDVSDNRKIVWSVGGTYWDVDDGDANAWVQNEAFFFDDPRYPLPIEAPNRYVRFNIHTWDGTTTYIYENPYGAPIEIPNVYKEPQWGPQGNRPLISLAPNGDIILPAQKLTWTGTGTVWPYHEIQGYDFIDPLIRYGIRSEELPPPYPGTAIDKNRILPPRTILMATLPNIPEQYVVNGKVLMNAPALFFVILLGADENPYKQYLSQGIAYAPIPTNPENLPRVKWQDIWGREHSAPLRTMDPQFKKSNDFFPVVKVYPTVNDTYELYLENDNPTTDNPYNHTPPYTRDGNEKLYLEYDVTKSAKLHLIVKNWNGSREFEQIFEPSEEYKINKDQSLIVKKIFRGLGFDTKYDRYWLTDYQNIGNPTQLVDEKDDPMFHTLFFNQALNTGEKEEIHVWADMKTYHPDVHYEGPMKVNEGSRYVFHKPKEGPNQYMIMDAHVQAVWGLCSNVEISKKVAPVNIGNYGDTVFHIIKVEDPYEPREFEMETYLKTYGFGRITASTFVGGRIDDKLCSPRLAPGHETFVRIEVCNNLGGGVDNPYTLRDVTIEPDFSDSETNRIVNIDQWMQITVDEILNSTPPVHQDLSYLLAAQDEPKIPDGWRGIVYFRIKTIPANIPEADKGKVHKIKFKMTCNEPGNELANVGFEIPTAWIGIEDANASILTTYGSSTIVTLTDAFPSFVTVKEAKLANLSEKTNFEQLIGLDVNQRPRGTQAATYFDEILDTNVGFNPDKGTVTFTLPQNAQIDAQQIPWYEGSKPKQDFYLIVKSITDSTRSGIKVVNEGPEIRFKNHFDETGSATGNLETVVVHGPSMHQEYIVNQIRRAFNGEITNTLTLDERNEVDIKVLFVNSGDDIAETPKITMNLDEEVDLIAAYPGTNTQQGNTIIWEWGEGGNIAPGSEKNILITLSLTPKKGKTKGPKPTQTEYFDLIGSTSITYRDAFLGIQVTPPPLGTLTLPAMAPSVTAPTNLQAVGHPGSISLTWDYNMGTDTTFNIYRTDIPPIGTVSFKQIDNEIGTTSYIDTTVTEDIPYYYVVTAVSSGEEGPMSNVGSATPIDIWPPGTITDLQVIDITSNSATLEWSAPGDNDFKGTASAYIIKYAPIGVSWDNADLLPSPPIPGHVGSIQQATITGLLSDTLYRFYIRTKDEVDNFSGIATLDKKTLVGPITTKTVHLRAGWNLFSLPLIPTISPYTAEKLVQDINADGGTADIVQHWTEGSEWEAYQVGVPEPGQEFHRDMPIKVGKGYFVHCKNNSDWQMRGSKIESQAINFRESWNLIGIGVATTTAKSVLQNINAQNGSVTIIQRWTEGSNWVGYQFEFPEFYNFTTNIDEGYFIYSKKVSKYSPNWLRETNFISTPTDNQVTISWITTSNLKCKVLYGTTTAFGNEAFDDRGAGVQVDTHFVTINNLKPNTTYFYTLVCGNSTDPEVYSFTTAPTKNPQPEDKISGYVKKDGSPVVGAIVYVKIKKTSAQSSWAACLTGGDGKWEIDKKKIRTENLEGFFEFVANDKIYIEVEAASVGKTTLTVDADTTIVDDINL